MPDRDRIQKFHERQSDPASKSQKECAHCGSYFSSYKGAWKIHEKACKSKKLLDKSDGLEIHEPAISQASQALEREKDADDDTSQPRMLDDWWEGHGAEQSSRLHDKESSSSCSGESSIGSEEHGNDVPLLCEGQTWIKRHPASNIPSGFLDGPSVQPNDLTQPHRLQKLPAYAPFRTMEDFCQAEIFSKFGTTDEHINCQLGLKNAKFTLKDAKDYHAILAQASRLQGSEFITRKIVTEFEGHCFEHYVHFQPVFPALANIVADPEFATDMVFYPEHRYVHRPGTNRDSMQVWEELWHGKNWWYMQDQLLPGQCILYLVLYIDETNVSTIGGVKVWPVYLWVGNLPASIRKRRGRKGGAILVGYLPKAVKNLAVKDMAGLRCKVYHDALSVIFESLKIPARYGAPMRCGDGVTRTLVPTIAVSSADYMEFIRMICILGHKSGFPCPICLVPREEQSQLDKSWPMRTVESTEALLERAALAATAAERDDILRKQSLRNVRSTFLDIIPPFHSIYAAAITDPLHQIEQGIWGKHLWPWLMESFSKEQKAVLDKRIKSVPRYPDLKHFPNGITSLEYITATEHGVILRIISPLIEDMLVKDHQKLILNTIRSLAIIHAMVKFTTHNDATLEELESHISEFNKLHAKLVHVFEVDNKYPKFHSISHVVDILQRHSTTDNYHTGLGEALHPQSKRDYRRTNHHPDFEIQMLRMYQEREAIIRIRARIDAETVNSAALQDNNESISAWDGPRVQLGSADRELGQHLATQLVSNQTNKDPLATRMARDLSTFLYQRVDGFARGSQSVFREKDLPLLDGMMAYMYHLVSVGYSSTLDFRDGLDIARVTDSWRGQGPRHDFVLVDDGKEQFVAQLLNLFTLKARSQTHSLAYVHVFKITKRKKRSGYIELTDGGVRNFIFLESIVRSCVVLSPGVKRSKHVLWDLEGSDMYLRLKTL